MEKIRTFPEEFAIPAGQAEAVTLDGQDYLLVEMECACRVWQIALGNTVGRCGVCGVRPEKTAHGEA